MSDTIFSLWGRAVRYAEGKFREQNESFIWTLARQGKATLLVTQDPYHSVVMAGEHRMPLPVFCELVGFKTQDGPDSSYTTHYEEAMAFLRTHSTLREVPRTEIVTERGALRAWGSTGGVLWHIWAGAVALPYTHYISIWAHGGGALSVREDGGLEFRCCLPESLTTAVGLVPTNPRGFWALLATLVPADRLNKVWPTNVVSLPVIPRTICGREIDWPGWIRTELQEQGKLFFESLAQRSTVDLLVTCLDSQGNPYDYVIVAGDYRMSLKDFTWCLDFVDEYHSQWTGEYDKALKFLRTNWKVEEKERSEVVRGRETLRAWGKKAGVLWCLNAAKISGPYEGRAVTLFAGRTWITLYARENGIIEEFAGELPAQITDWAGEDGVGLTTHPVTFWRFLRLLGLSREDLLLFWPNVPAGK